MRPFPLLLSCLALVLLTACPADQPGGKGSTPAPAKKPTSYPVEVETVEERSLAYLITAVGSVAAFERVYVTARVAGVVENVKFKEGSEVKANQLLVEIEPKRYEVALAAAKAAYERAQAVTADASAALKRREDALAATPGIIPKEEIASAQTRLVVAQAEESQAKAAFDQADLNHRDASVRAPVSGVIDTRSVETGRFVQAGTALGTLVQRDPLLLRFNVPEADAVHLHKDMELTFTVRERNTEYRAKITHVSSTASETARSIAVIAEIDATQRDTLRPGAFAEIRIQVAAARAAPVIPQIAIRPTERGFLGFVIENNTASERLLNLGMRTDDGKVEVRSGLRAGEQLVVRGGEALRHGVTVHIRPSAAKPSTDTSQVPAKPHTP